MIFSGESWIGLDKLHQLTSERSYSLKITMTDYDKKTFVAVYNNFKVGHRVFKCKSISKAESHNAGNIDLIMTQVGPGEDYVLTVESYNHTLSTLGDAMANGSPQSHNGMKFTTRLKSNFD